MSDRISTKDTAKLVRKTLAAAIEATYDTGNPRTAAVIAHLRGAAQPPAA